jgi:hypothetical protein
MEEVGELWAAKADLGARVDLEGDRDVSDEEGNTTGMGGVAHQVQMEVSIGGGV